MLLNRDERSDQQRGGTLRRYTEEEKAEILKEVENLGNVSLVAKKHGMPSTTIQNWIRKGMNKSNPSETRQLKKTISQQKLQISIFKDLFKKTHQIFLERKAVAKFYINQGHEKSLVLRTCGLSRSGYYKKFSKEQVISQINKKNQIKRKGRPFPGYSLDFQGKQVSDPIILEILKCYRDKKEFQNWGGYKVLSCYLLRDHSLKVNAKKVYRLCREFGLLLPRPKKEEKEI